MDRVVFKSVTLPRELPNLSWLHTPHPPPLLPFRLTSFHSPPRPQPPLRLNLTCSCRTDSGRCFGLRIRNSFSPFQMFEVALSKSTRELGLIYTSLTEMSSYSPSSRFRGGTAGTKDGSPTSAILFFDVSLSPTFDHLLTELLKLRLCVKKGKRPKGPPTLSTIRDLIHFLFGRSFGSTSFSECCFHSFWIIKFFPFALWPLLKPPDLLPFLQAVPPDPTIPSVQVKLLPIYRRAS